MAHATTAKVLSTATPFADTKIKRKADVATARTFVTGCMVALTAATDRLVYAEAITGLKFDGIVADSVYVDVATTDTFGEKIVTVDRPWRFRMKIAAAAAGDIGKPVYALFNNEVTYTATAGVRVGWVDDVISATEVEIAPIYAGYGL